MATREDFEQMPSDVLAAMCQDVADSSKNKSVTEQGWALNGSGCC
jgi:hypothetical protein